MRLIYAPPSAGAPVAAAAPDSAYEHLGIGDGTGTLVTSGLANVDGAWTAIGTPSVDCNEITIHLGTSSNTNRYRLSLSWGAANTLLVENLVVMVSTSTTLTLRLPLRLPAGEVIYARAATSSSTQTARLSLRARVRRTLEFAGFSAAISLHVDAATTRAGTVAVPLVADFTGAWTSIVTPAPILGGLVYYIGSTATASVTAQGVTVEIGAGASPVRYDALLTKVPASVTVFASIGVATTPIPASTPLSARVVGLTPGSDAVYVGLLGLVA